MKHGALVKDKKTGQIGYFRMFYVNDLGRVIAVIDPEDYDFETTENGLFGDEILLENLIAI